MNLDRNSVLLITKHLLYAQLTLRKKEARIKLQPELLRMIKIKILNKKNLKIGRKNSIINRKLKTIKMRHLF